MTHIESLLDSKSDVGVIRTITEEEIRLYTGADGTSKDADPATLFGLTRCFQRYIATG